MADTKRIKRIAVGIDGSKQSEAALEWTIDLATATASEVIAVHATDLPSIKADASGIPLQFHDGWRKTIRAQFENVWCKPLRQSGLRYRAVMKDGRPATAISGVAERDNADIIVVGRRGRGVVTQLLLGSVSYELVLRSKVPVMVVGPQVAARRTSTRRAR